MLLIDQLGMEGYGIWWALLEKLRAEATHKLPFSILNSFARRWATSQEKIIAVVKNYQLFCFDDNFFYSNRLTDDMKTKSDSARKSLSYRWKDSDVLRPYNDPNTDGIRNDTKRKEKKRKEKRGVGRLSLPNGNGIQGEYFDLKKKIIRFADGSARDLSELEFQAAQAGTLNPNDIKN
jgi:hypothetical protein